MHYSFRILLPAIFSTAFAYGEIDPATFESDARFFTDTSFSTLKRGINPLFPASGPATGSYNGIHRESNFLAAMTPGATNLGSLRSRLRTPLRNAPLRAAPSATAAQIRVPRHSSLDPRSMISYPFPAPRHHSLV